MNTLARYAGQAVCYGLFVAFIGYFSTSPTYVHMAPDQALVKLSISHAGQVKEPCRRRSDEELAKLAPNMRTPMDCPRERSALQIQLELDGEPLYQAQVPPAGFARDGASASYRRFVVPAGRHHLRARLRDHVRLPDFNYNAEADIDLKPGQVFVVDFNARSGGFILK